MKLVCFHGSPGSPEEFLPLEREMKKLSPSLKVERICRDGYGAESSPSLRGKIILGYSWGAADALLKVLDSREPIAGFVFVAPYVFPRKKLGSIARVLLSTPGVSSLLLSRVAGKRIDEFVEKSSAPCAPSEEYRRVAESLKFPAILRTAVLEKEGRAKEERICLALRALAAKGGQGNVPIGLIWGAQDQISEEATQIEPLRKIFPWIRGIRIDNAGHALQWTHSSELATAITRVFEIGEKTA